MNDNLFAWADTAAIGVGDHTWVSSYQPADGEPDPTKGHYWYCWGISHERATLLSTGVGGVEFACKIATPHDKSAKVGIEYGRDGVCHQMANRLLRFSLNENKQPITVSGAKGYQLTKAMYGEYGEKALTNEQRKRVQRWEVAVRDHQKSM